MHHAFVRVLPLAAIVACRTAPPESPTCAEPTAHVEGRASTCGSGATPETVTAMATRTDAQGRVVQTAGAALAAGTSEVALTDVLHRGAELKGKTVILSGHVAAMCHHKRGWFALVPDDPSGSFVRVLTAPAFLVPADAVGKVARAEGVIDTIEVAPDAARHFAGEHKLGDPASINGPVQQVVLRATGAEFL
jgi:hypothetical protein